VWAVKISIFGEIQDSRQPPSSEIEKWPYVRNGLTDQHKIWHGDVCRPSELYQQSTFQIFENPTWGRSKIEKSYLGYYFYQ